MEIHVQIYYISIFNAFSGFQLRFISHFTRSNL